MTRTALYYYLDKRQGRGISDEDVPAYILGFNDALDAMESDETYYGASDGKPGRHSAVEDAVTFVRNHPFQLPKSYDTR